MTMIVFCGPTLGADEVCREVQAEVRPPAACGDVLRAVLAEPEAIGLVDGYFDRVPSVWHKEILWAMSEGVHVFGAASMGAVRAAELESFGMVGVGAIFEAYHCGAVLDDDEVAVTHAPQEHGYRPQSEAMVNIRATLSAAQRANVVGGPTAARLAQLAKGLFYSDRSYPGLLALAERSGVGRAEVSALRTWLPVGRVDQKRQDALLMLRRMREGEQRGWQRKSVDYTFVHTDAWEALRRSVYEEQSRLAGRTGTAVADDVMNELLARGCAGAALDGAMARGLSLELARLSHVKLDARAVEAVIDDVRRERRLFEGADFDGWLTEQHLAGEDIVRYFRGEATFRGARACFGPEISGHLTDHLRATGEYGQIAARGQAKRAVLRARGLDAPALGDAHLSEGDLWQWYFVEHLGRNVPENLEAYARGERTDLRRLRSAALRELLYIRLSETSAPT